MGTIVISGPQNLSLDGVVQDPDGEARLVSPPCTNGDDWRASHALGPRRRSVLAFAWTAPRRPQRV